MEELLEKYPRAEKTLKYGTAGFRDRAELPLAPTFVRMGMLAVIRSESCNGLAVGVMITASHNPEPDNGLKLIDTDGGMLSQEWEPLCEAVANANTAKDVVQMLQNLREKHKINRDATGSSSNATVYIGRDTRPHSLELMGCVVAGIQAAGGTVRDLGEVATPLLHFAVASANAGTAPVHQSGEWDANIVLNHYYETLAQGFTGLCNTAAADAATFSIVLDSSFGVGSHAAIAMSALLTEKAPDMLRMDIRNAAGEGPVNAGCGAEHVQKGLIPPCGVSADQDAGKMLISFDGDADRVVFHTFPTASGGNDQWTLLDGDKIMCLIAVTLQAELQEAGLGDFKLGAVQTAYANGASSDYLRSVGVPIAVAKTGVKFVHHKALLFDCGIYFEANGHGTVLFSAALLKKLNSIQEPLSSSLSEQESRAWLATRRLRLFLLAINQSVGDALSDMLVALACLAIQGWSLEDWISIYTDYPSRQLKVAVKNKSLITCSDDETTALTPEALPTALAEAMNKIERGRCFVRPSGTEDVVRVYAEAADRAAADILAAECVTAVKSALGEE
jgi:phosphoacetylglucosamine mutase